MSFIIEIMKNFQRYFTVSVLIITAFLSSCQGTRASSDVLSPDETAQPEAPPSNTPKPTATFTPEPTFTPSATPIVILDPEPIMVNFITEDGEELEGIYYPAPENPAPLIILLHWARGDSTEWDQIAPWLQNRDQLVRIPDYNHSWRSSDWFPEFSSEGPLGVFVFTLRDCQDGCQTYDPEGWLLDIEAAMLKASQLQGVDKNRILTAGASIGADGALYGCAWLNQSGTGSCKGSFSLSPASLLTLPYEELAGQLIGLEPPLPVYCLFGLRDDASVETCSEIPGLISVDYGYIENHGLELIQSGRGPDPLVLLNEFINSSLAE
jgi:dienelactone hydrolase